MRSLLLAGGFGTRLRPVTDKLPKCLVSTDTVAVLGLGGIGIAALLALSALEVQEIIAIDVSTEKLKLAEKLGATHIIDSSSQDVESILKGIFAEGVDACIECAGSVLTIELGFKLIRKSGGQLLFASHPPDGEMIRLAPHELISGKRISGSWGGGSLPDQDIPKMYEALSRTGKVLETLLKDVYPLSRINDALDDLAEGRTFRPLIQMPH